MNDQQLYHKIIYLMPEAKFSFWLDDGREKEWDEDEEECHCDYVKLDGRCIAWLKSNEKPCPSLEELDAVTDQMIADDIEKRRKAHRDQKHCEDLSLVAAFDIAQSKEPELTFSGFLDRLEQKVQVLRSNIMSKGDK